jgi:hypothetical protein
VLNDHFYRDSGRFGGITTFSADHTSLHFDGTSCARRHSHDRPYLLTPLANSAPESPW